MTLIADYHEGISTDPIKDVLPMTKHGESRLKNCEKFKIQESYRLVTTFNNGIRHLCFLGNHDATEKFLERSRQTELYVDEENRLTSLKKSIVSKIMLQSISQNLTYTNTRVNK